MASYDLQRLKRMVPGAGTPGAESGQDSRQNAMRQQRMQQYLPPGATFDQPVGGQAPPQGAPAGVAPDQMMQQQALQQMAMQEAAQQAMAAQRQAALQPVQQQVAVPGASPDMNALAGQAALQPGASALAGQVAPPQALQQQQLMQAVQRIRQQQLMAQYGPVQPGPQVPGVLPGRGA